MNIIHYNPALDLEDRQAIRRQKMEEEQKKTRGRKAKPEGAMRKNTFNSYFTPEAMARLTSRVDENHGETRNSRLQADLATHWAMLDIGLALARQQLTRSEAKLILDVCNGTYWDAGSVAMMTGGGLLLSVRDGIALESLDQKWGVDAKSMIARMEGLERISHLALLDFARLFWAKHKDIDLDEYVNKFQGDE
jgi:hypothetical protein